MRISVIVPSRLAVNPADENGNPFLDRALQFIQRQSADHVELEVLVGLDAKHPPIPDRYRCNWVKFAESEGEPSQAKAVNAAAKLITGDVVAFCEDDDYWDREKLRFQLEFREKYDFVSCNQRVTDIMGGWIGTNNFATPSGWLMKREVWEAVGGFDEGFKYHVDTEWLGRLNALGKKRVHLVAPGAGAKPEWSQWLAAVGRKSDVIEIDDISDPLVNRFVHAGSGMDAINEDSKRLWAQFGMDQATTNLAQVAFMDWAAGQDSPFGSSLREHAIMKDRFGGGVPW